jgi:hypothetical protein
MLVLSGGQAESWFDLGLGLPVEVAELPADLAGLDVLLDDMALLAPIAAAWDVALGSAAARSMRASVPAGQSSVTLRRYRQFSAPRDGLQARGVRL